MNICSLVGTNIRKARHEKGWSQEELAHQSGVDRSYISEVESGKKNLGITRLDAIAKALGISARDLLDNK